RSPSFERPLTLAPFDSFPPRRSSDLSLLFAHADLTVPLPTSNPLLAELHERFAGEYLQHFDHAQTSYRAREVIIRRLPDGEPRRSEEHTSELQSRENLVCRLLLEKQK